MADPPRQAPVGDADLRDAEVKNDTRVRRRERRNGKGREQRDGEGEQVARRDGGETGVRGAVTAEPTQTDEHEGIGDTAGKREDVAVRGIGRGGDRAIGGGEEEGHSDSDGGDVNYVGAANGLVKQERAEERNPEGRRGLQKDRVGGSSQAVGENE